MPDTHFLIQEDLTALDEIRKSSALPSFATNITVEKSSLDNRILIPFNNPEVNITFFLLYKKENRKIFERII